MKAIDSDGEGQFTPPSRPLGPPVEVIRDGSSVSLVFNVMPARDVSETLHIREYRLWPDYAEARWHTLRSCSI